MLALSIVDTYGLGTQTPRPVAPSCVTQDLASSNAHAEKCHHQTSSRSHATDAAFRDAALGQTG
ncbi:hypothetical protein SAMN06265222_108113 [Neorhodopirellula lusitana]|uniref:Uncharacterized protein n=1 Tax=Neorhodopirellula lusitana TaxID=445327 RepID=A0ABY1Q913_9BACT|nr:hypothetical protein SAMN06265222_108113 [Neorhodopirellula lusitana]